MVTFLPSSPFLITASVARPSSVAAAAYRGGGRGIRYEWRRLDGSMGETRDAQMNEEEEEEEEACLQRLVAEFLRIALHRSCAYFCANCYQRILHGG